MITRTIKLESKEFGPLVGREITVRVPETPEDRIAMVQKGESDVTARFSESIVRAQNNLARSTVKTILKNEKDADKALAALQAKIDGYKYTEREAGEGGAPAAPKTPKGRQNKAAQGSGNRLFEKCLADEALLARMIKQNIVDADEFAEWKTAREEAAAAAKPTA